MYEFKRKSLPRIILLFVAVVTLVTVVAVPTSASFTGKESSLGNELIAEEFVIVPNGTDSTDLSVPQFYSISGDDVYPSSSNVEFVSLKLSSESTPYWACAKLTLNDSAENAIIKPELAALDSTNGLMAGELDKYLDFVIWADKSGDSAPGTDFKYDLTDKVVTTVANDLIPNKFSVLKSGSNFSLTYTIADSSKNLFTDKVSDPLQGNVKYRLGSAWCYGDFTPSATATSGLSCTFPTGLNANDAQTDSLDVSLEFYIVQYKNNNSFTCDQWRVSDSL